MSEWPSIPWEDTLTNNIEPRFQDYFKICHPREHENLTKFGDQIKKENSYHTLQNISVTIKELLLYNLFTIDQFTKNSTCNTIVKH